MRLTRYLLPLLPLAWLSVANVQQCEHGQQNCPDIDPDGLIRADLIVKFLGMVYHSRCLGVEAKHATSNTAEKTVDDILLDLKIGSNIILLHAAILEETEPFNHALIDDALFRLFETWEIHTSRFLKTLAQSAGLFREAAPHLMPALVRNLTVHEENAAEFCVRVYEVVPSLATHVSLATVRLMSNFQDTIESFTDKPHVLRHASDSARTVWESVMRSELPLS